VNSDPTPLKKEPITADAVAPPPSAPKNDSERDEEYRAIVAKFGISASGSFHRRRQGYKMKVAWICKYYLDVFREDGTIDYCKLVNYYWKFFDHLLITCEHCKRLALVQISPERFATMGQVESIDRGYRHGRKDGLIVSPGDDEEKRTAMEQQWHDYFADDACEHDGRDSSDEEGWP
jgi:hypothetical protein